MKNINLKGFTLLEMVVVLAIITLLALMMIPSLLGSSMRNAYKDGKESADMLLLSVIRKRERLIKEQENPENGNKPGDAEPVAFPGSYKEFVDDSKAEAPLSEGEHFIVDLEKCPNSPNLYDCVRVCLEYHSELARKIKKKFEEDPHNLEGDDLKPCKQSDGNPTKAWNIRI